MPNLQVTHDSSPTNARSESNIAINPNNPLQIVAASKKFTNILAYYFTLATQYSQDGGQSWHDSAPLDLAGYSIMTDPTLAWDDSGNVFLIGLACVPNSTPPPAVLANEGSILVYKSTNGGQSWSTPVPIAGTNGRQPGQPLSWQYLRCLGQSLDWRDGLHAHRGRWHHLDRRGKRGRDCGCRRLDHHRHSLSGD